MSQSTEIEGKRVDKSVSEYENHIKNYEELFLDSKCNLDDLITNSNITKYSHDIQKVQLIINKKDGSFIVNPDLIELIKDLKNGKAIRIKEITKGEQIEQKITFEQIATKTSSIRLLIEQFMFNIEGLVKYINEKQRKFFKQWIGEGETFQSLSDDQRKAYFHEFSRFLYIECTAAELFTEDSFNIESGLFSGKNYDYYQKLEPLSGILVKYLSSTMKGELAIILVFLHSLLLMKSEPHIEFASKFQYVAKQVAENIQSKAEISHKFGGKNFVITNYYNPFIHIDFSAEQNNQISIDGWMFRKPSGITYRDGIWFDKLPFTLNEEKKILRIIKKDWNKPKGFSENISRKNLPSIRKEMRIKYQCNDKQIPIEMLYVHNKYFSKNTADEFKEKISKQIINIPKQSKDWYSYLIYRQEVGYIQGKDMFDTCNFILLETYSDENNNIKARYISDSNGNYIRNAIIEIESKSSYFKNAPYAVKYQEFGYTNKIQKRFGGIFVNNEDLKIVIKRFLEGIYDICFSKEGKKKSLRQELGLTNSTLGNWNNKRNYSKALKVLKDNRFDLLGKRIDRIETKTAVSCQKHLLRRLINTVENNPELIRNYNWYEKLTSKNVSERNKNFVFFIEKIMKKYEEYHGLILKEEILELVSNYNASILYYNLLLFSSGYPVLTFNSDFLKYDFYLPQEFNILSKMPTNTSTPTWRGITGGLTKLVNSSLNLRVKVIMPDQKNERRVVTLSKSTFHKPIRIEKNGSLRWVYALQILEGASRKVMVVTKNGYTFKKIKKVKNQDSLELNNSEIIYGVATFDKERSDLSGAYAKEKLVQLLLYGGEQYNGLKIGAIINLFNERSSDKITDKQVKMPFLHFLLVASNKTTGNKQVISLTNPILGQQMKKSKSNTKRDILQFKYRPSILGVAYYTLNQLLGTKLDLSVAFGDSTKFYDEVYWASGKYRSEKMDSVSKVTKGRKKDVAKILFAFKHTFNNIFGEKRKRGIDRIYFSLFVKENRVTNQISFSNEKLDKHYFMRKIGIPLVSKKAVSSETYTWYQTVAKAPHILLKDINELRSITKKREPTNIKHRHRASVCFVKMIDEIGKELPEKIHTSEIWKILMKIRSKYIMNDLLQISPEDWAMIIKTMFPEIITAPTIPYVLRKTHLSKFDIKRLDFDAPSPNELLKLFNNDTTRFSCYTPYNTLYNFIGIFLMSTWKISSKNSNKTCINYPFNDWTQPEIVIKPFLRNWLPFLIYRAQSLQNFFLDPEKNFNIFDTKQILESKFISTEFYEIMNYSFDDIKRGKTLLEGIQIKIPLHERILWMLVRESQYIDTLSFKLKNYREKRESSLEFSGYFDEVGLNEQNVDEFIQNFGRLIDD
ncbi:MAG: hypothetical protein ACTSYP_01580 [Candidatus Heimdallarchaeaceae archaeon]